jgi:hypothetical protein
LAKDWQPCSSAPHLVENVKMVLDVLERTVLSGSLCK